MVAQRHSRLDLSRPKFAVVREFLTNAGVSIEPVDDRFFESAMRAIQRNGWDADVTHDANSGEWSVAIRESDGAPESRTAIARDVDRVAALLDALRYALSWTSREADQQAFDAQTRSLLGLSGSEFMTKWRSHELSSDDPRVAYLLVARPVGW